MENPLKKLNKIGLPATIIIASLILGGAFYAVQVNKQKSIERQQEIDNALSDLKLKRDECKALSVGVMKQWNNVMGVTYDNDVWKECVVTYTDTKTGEVQTEPLRLMQTNK